MKIIYPPELKPFLKDKHLLLDTNIFRDFSSKSTSYTNFFNDLKKDNVTFATIDLVRYELLKGSSDNLKYEARDNLINDIVDVIIPVIPKTCDLVYELIKEYGVEGSAVGITDLYLGSMLMHYKENICLMTRDTSDFIERIFSLQFVINVQHQKGIYTYGIYQYKKL